jgi:cell wall-associated NlpC family hydrolase
MTPWTPIALEAAQTEAERWLGTPHRNRMAKPGVGVDCLHLLGQIATAAGVLPPFRFPYYDPNWGIGRRNNVLERIFMLTTNCDRIDPNEAMQEGDVIIFAVGRQSNHCAIYLGSAIWHAQCGQVVKPEPPEELSLPIQSIIRLTAIGFKRRPETLTKGDLAP